MKKLEGVKKYETETLLNQYLLFHYGSDHDLLPFSFGPKDSLHFPIRCVTEGLANLSISKQSTALDIGCAVGRSSFELSRFSRHVVGIDTSKSFIEAAKKLQELGTLDYVIYGEGTKPEFRIARLPQGIDPKSVNFECSAAEDLFEANNTYDVVLAANLICRLEHPQDFLSNLPHLISPGGILIIASPYSWLRDFTSPDNWMDENSLEIMKKIFKGKMSFVRAFDLPFLLREHYRKYEWGVSQVTIWRKN